MLKPLVFSVLVSYPMTPTLSMTPGDFCDEHNRDFDGYRYAEQIPHCKRNVSTATKRKVYEAYHIPEKDREQYTIDHLIPLSLGGSNSIKNLWPEAKELKRVFRPTLEEDLFQMLQDGDIDQEEAVDCILMSKFDLKDCFVLE